MMTLMDLPPHYSGIARVLPAGSSVLFPSVLQSVQVKDPVSAAAVKYALESDELLVFATNFAETARPSSGSGVDENSQIDARITRQVYRMVCLSRIVEIEEIADGYSMSLLGIRRAWIRREVPTTHPFRLVDLQILSPDENDFLLPMDVESLVDLNNSAKDQLFNRLCLIEFWNRELRKCLQKRIPEIYATIDSMQRLLDAHQSLESLTDLAAHFLRLPKRFKLQQLQCIDSVERAQRLIHLFGQLDRIGLTDQKESGPGSKHLGWALENQDDRSADAAEHGRRPSIDYQSQEFEDVIGGLISQGSSSDSGSNAGFADSELMVLDSQSQSFPGSAADDPQDCNDPTE